MQEAIVSFPVNGVDVNLSKEDQKFFWSRVSKGEGCWIWKGPFRKRYGSFEIRKRKMFAHRVAFAISHGELPQTLLVCHRCDNPPCCNPAHLFLGTHADNRKDCVSKGREARCSGSEHWTALREHDSFNGVKNPNSVLSEEDVRTIRFKHKNERISQAQLAREYLVSANQINLIVRGLSWAHIT